MTSKCCVLKILRHAWEPVFTDNRVSSAVPKWDHKSTGVKTCQWLDITACKNCSQGSWLVNCESVYCKVCSAMLYRTFVGCFRKPLPAQSLAFYSNSVLIAFQFVPLFRPWCSSLPFGSFVFTSNFGVCVWGKLGQVKGEEGKRSIAYTPAGAVYRNLWLTFYLGMNCRSCNRRLNNSRVLFPRSLQVAVIWETLGTRLSSGLLGYRCPLPSQLLDWKFKLKTDLYSVDMAMKWP